MKIRNGFVSNSSSSSFLVAFYRKPKTKKDLQEMLFCGFVVYPNPYPWANVPANWPAEVVTETVWKDMHRKGKNKAGPLITVKQIEEVFEHGEFEGQPAFPDIPRDISDKEYNKIWTEYNKKHAAAAKIVAKKFVDKNMKRSKDCVFYKFNYSDDSTYGAALEHGNLFNRLIHVRFSNH